MNLPPGLRERLQAHAPKPEDVRVLLALLLQPAWCHRGPRAHGWQGPPTPARLARPPDPRRS